MANSGKHKKPGAHKTRANVKARSVDTLLNGYSKPKAKDLPRVATWSGGKHQITTKDLDDIELYAQQGCLIEFIAVMLGLSERSFKYYVNNNQAMADSVARGRIMHKQKFLNHAQNLALEGDSVAAMKYYGEIALGYESKTGNVNAENVQINVITGVPRTIEDLQDGEQGIIEHDS